MAQVNQKYSAREQQDYHNKLAKPGAVKYNRSTGEKLKVSDFERGVHKAKADQIFKARRKAAIKYNRAK